MDHDDDFCAAVGLVRADPNEPGITRRRCGSGFTYRWPDGTVVRGPHRRRCEELVLPPAWRDVWICPDPDGHVQAVGTDDADRRQHRYHERWTAARNAEKFDRLAEVGARLSSVRRAVAGDLHGADPVRRRLAAMVRLMDRTLERVGNAESVERFDTRGISTLGPEHVETSRHVVRLAFRAKGGADHEDVVVDRDLARAVAELEAESRDWLFEIEGTVLGADDANAYLASHSAGVIGCKDLRTWGGSAAALAERIGGSSDSPRIADAAADVLHNTRAVARASYVHPAVFQVEDDAVHDAWRSSRRSRWYEREERALLRLLDGWPSLLASHCRP